MRFRSVSLAILLPALAASAAAQNYARQVLPSTPGQNDYFGHSVAISDSTILVGAPNDDDIAFDAGAAYLIDAVTGATLHKLTRQAGAAVDRFGWAAAIHGDRAVVGSYQNARGAATLFDVTTGQEIMDLDPGQTIDAMDFYAGSVAITDQVIAVSARGDDDAGNFAGAVYLFDPTTGLLRTKVTPPDLDQGDVFGSSLAAEGSTVYVGAGGLEVDPDRFGAIYVIDGLTGTATDKWTPAGNGPYVNLGTSLSVAQGRLAAAAKGGLFASAPSSVFLFDTVTGNVIERIDQIGLTNQFGDCTGLSSSSLVIGAHDVGVPFIANTGRAYLYSIPSGELIADLSPPNLKQGDQLGWSAAANDTYTVVGAWHDHNSGFQDAGCIYIYSPVPTSQDFCSPAVPSSWTLPAVTTVFGSAAAQDQDMQLRATFLPDNVFAFFLASRTTGFLPGAGGSQGNLCLGGSIARLNRPGEVGMTTWRSWGIEVPFSNIPEPGTGGVPVLAGETWHFQCWYRDDVPGVGLTSNYTNATSVVFE